MKRCFRTIGILAISFLPLVSCEEVDDDIDRHTSASDSTRVQLDHVAEILAAVPLQQEHLNEVHKAAVSSAGNGYDEEYTMRNLFEAPGCGVGDPRTKSIDAGEDQVLLKDLIEQHVRRNSTRSASGVDDPDRFLEALSASDIQIYWPFSENWDGKTLPVITFDPEDDSDANIGYRLFQGDDGTRRVEEVIVDEVMAMEVPVWVVNRNSDAGYTTLEMLRREDPDWGEGGGTIIVKPAEVTSRAGKSLKTLVLKDFTMTRNFDSWFAGASEFFVKTGSLNDFTASTEAELHLYDPMITDFMISVRRSQVNKPQPFNAMLVSDWNGQMTHCAFMITEDDGGTKTEWKCTALVRVESKSYGIEMNLPFNSRDDVVWRGHLTDRWIEANSGMPSRFGDIVLTFEVIDML
jgi:hypothetical protein